MTRANQILSRFSSLWIILASLIPALALAYFVWTETEPAPRRIVTFEEPIVPKETSSVHSVQSVAFSPDSKSLILHIERWTRDDPQFKGAALHVIDLPTGEHLVLCEDKNPHIVFSPDGTRIAGAWKDFVFVWNRRTGAEMKRFAVAAEKRMEDRDPLLAFIQEKPPGGLIVPETHWTPLWKALATLNWIYGDGQDPAPTEGVKIVDAKGTEHAFLRGDGDFSITPDGETLISLRRLNDSKTMILTIYDWPLKEPWWRAVSSATLVFVVLVLILRFSGWFRSQ